MSSSLDLKFISERLALPPFSKSLSVIQIHDELKPVQLLQLINDVVAYIDDANQYSPHRNVDVRDEQPEDTVNRLGDFLKMLKLKDAISDL